MENFLFSLNVVAPLFFLMAAGYIARYFRLITDAFLSEGNKFVFRLCLPLMLFQNIRTAFRNDFSNYTLVIYSVCGILAVILLSVLLVPLFVKKRPQRGSIIQAIYRSNFLIYGIPLATGMYGTEAMEPISVLMGTTIPVFNIAAVIILSIYSEKENVRIRSKQIFYDILKNPLILGCVAGAAAGLLKLEFPVAINRPLTELAGIATPLALFVMGGDFKFRRLRNNLIKVLATGFIRLIIVPLLAVTVYISLGFRTVELSALLCIFATPTAVSSYIMAENMGCDGELAGQIVVFTTVCSCFSIFGFVYVLRGMGYL